MPDSVRRPRAWPTLAIALVLLAAAGTATAQADARVIVKFRHAAAVVRLHPLAATAGAREAADSAAARADTLNARHGLHLKSGRMLSERAQVLFSSELDAAALVKRLGADPDVEYAVIDQRRHRLLVPNDPLYAQGPAISGSTGGPAVGQWYLRAPAGEIASSINAPSAWDRTTGSSSIVVAVLDTGVRPEHPDLAGRLLAGYNMVSDPTIANNGVGRDADASDPGDWVTRAESRNSSGPFFGCTVENSSWHGTMTSSLIGAATNNGTGLAGVAWGIKLQPVRVLGKCGGFDSDIIAGMEWAAGLSVPGVPANPNPARVINMSLGGSGTCAQSYLDALNAIGSLQNPPVIVAAAGNSDGQAVGTPANCPGVIAVGGLRHVGTKVGFSDAGPEIAISAPAGNCVNTSSSQPCLYPILAATNTGTTTPAASAYTDSFNYSIGTSFAAPLVAGTAALMLSVQPSMTPAQVKTVLQASARPFPSSGVADDPQTGPIPQCHAPDSSTQIQCYCTTSTCGAGMLDAGAAVAAAYALGTSADAGVTKDVRSYIPAAMAALGYTSYVRVINSGSTATPVSAALIDATTGAVGASAQLTAALPPGAAVTYSAQQIETALGVSLPAASRPRLRVSASVPIEVQSFQSNPTGVVGENQAAATGASSYYVPSYIPAALAGSGFYSFIRVINVGAAATPVQVAVVDGNSGATAASGQLTAALPSGGAATFTAQQIEAALGVVLPAGSRPRMLVSGSVPLEVQSFQANPGGVVTQNGSARGGTTVPVQSYIPAALAASGFSSFIRVINNGTLPTSVAVALIDASTGQTRASGQLASALPANAAVTFSAAQVEAALGVALDAQERPRILVTSPSNDLSVQSFQSNPGGVVTQNLETRSGSSIDVPSYIPAAMAQYGYAGFLRVINTGSAATPVSVALIDAATGQAGPARLLSASLPAGAAATFSAYQVEAALGGPLPAGDRPRIRVTANVPIEVQSFQSSPTGVVVENGGVQ